MDTAKRGRGRPRKAPHSKPETQPAVRRDRGRPRKQSEKNESDSPLGDFAKLPAELRNQIWSYTLDLQYGHCSTCRNIRDYPDHDHGMPWRTYKRFDYLNEYPPRTIIGERTAILRTSRAVHNEAHPTMMSINHFGFSMLYSGSLYSIYQTDVQFDHLSSCRCGKPMGQSIKNWRSWNAMRSVRNIKIYCSSLSIINPSAPPHVPWNVDYSAEFRAMVESLLPMDSLKSLILNFTLDVDKQMRAMRTEEEESRIGQDIEATAKISIMPFLCLRLLPKLALKIYIDADTKEGDYLIRAEYVERVREILTTPRDGEVPSIEGLQMMEFHERPEDTENEEDSDT